MHGRRSSSVALQLETLGPMRILGISDIHGRTEVGGFTPAGFNGIPSA